jgi:hypothetical protein
MWEGLLPLGSVVKLKKAEEHVMIMGYSHSPINKKERLYDYAGILYPYGYQNRKAVFLFDREDVEKVFYIGYMDERSKNFMETAEAAIDGLKSGAITEEEAKELYRGLLGDKDKTDDSANPDDVTNPENAGAPDDAEKGGE